MSLELIKVATILCMKILDLPSESFCEHGIEASYNNNQVYVLAEVSTMRSHVFFLLAIHHS